MNIHLPVRRANTIKKPSKNTLALMHQNNQTIDDLQFGFWPTPYKAAKVLSKHLPAYFTYCEPCAGDLRLVKHLKKLKPKAAVTRCFDIIKKHNDVFIKDARTLDLSDMYSSIYGEPDFIITNTPFEYPTINELIEHFMQIKPTWCMVRMHWLSGVSAGRILRHMKKIVAVGSLDWFDVKATSSTDHYAWILIDAEHSTGPKFIGREFREPKVKMEKEPIPRKVLYKGVWYNPKDDQYPLL